MPSPRARHGFGQQSPRPCRDCPSWLRGVDLPRSVLLPFGEVLEKRGGQQRCAAACRRFQLGCRERTDRWMSAVVSASVEAGFEVSNTGTRVAQLLMGPSRELK